MEIVLLCASAQHIRAFDDFTISKDTEHLCLFGNISPFNSIGLHNYYSAGEYNYNKSKNSLNVKV